MHFQIQINNNNCKNIKIKAQKSALMSSLHVLTVACPISFSVVAISSHLATIIFSTFSLETEECLLLEADPRLGKTRLRRGNDDGAPLSFPLSQVVFLFCDCDGFITG